MRRAAGEEISDESIIEAHPELMPELAQWLSAIGLLHVAQRRAAQNQNNSQQSFGVACPHCETGMSVGEDISLSQVTCPSCGQPFSIPDAPTLSFGPVSSAHGLQSDIPTRIGRYRIEKMLGQGAFGRVFLAHDKQLGRAVAVKVPHGRLVASADQAKAYLAEARSVANLDHPHIVPVHDVGSTDEFPCFIICKYVEGENLSKQLRKSRPSYTKAAEIVVIVADALHHAHTLGLVHRDVKPGNILIGTDGTPYLVDFGLALREENIGKGPRYAGTPAYMSPEQARGEGHRVDGRSDIFSLGVVLYELLVGRRPFQGDTQSELFEQVTSYEPRPVRQYDHQVPKELERICHKALAKRARDRYSTAKEFADDLRHFLAELSMTKGASVETNGRLGTPNAATATPDSSSGSDVLSDSDKATASGSPLDSLPVKIVPKGLRSFDAHDADFFLQLLPGPRDRNGLPESIRFWKTRIEETDPTAAFPVGLIYGPSGCGKSSLVKAGLLPRLSKEVIAVYVEATAEDTETRLLDSLRRRCPALDDKLNLQETLAALRRGQGTPVGKKVLVILDQFEQWLHANKENVDSELVRALRQCDGGHVQSIVMVRDDFWLAATRFMERLEIGLLQGRNSALVDVFDRDHARKVLAAFGRAFGKLPEHAKETSKQQKEFLKRSVAGLAEEGKVTCVRLALFAEMIKDKPWTPATLREAGGTKGIGVAFLEQTFSAQTAHPTHRLHERAARAVLRALLPDSGTNMKGEMKSFEVLLEASGYARRTHDFDDLIKVLDSELRLITPAETRVESPELRAKSSESDADQPLTLDSGLSTLNSFAGPDPALDSGLSTLDSFYQLTHDYLVPSLRDWLTRKQRETRRGRAELCLAERGALWSSKPENRRLPSSWECLRIAGLTSRRNWSASQRKMMRQAARVHGLRWAGVLLLVLVITGGVSRALLAGKKRSLSDKADALVIAMEMSRGIAVHFAIEDLLEIPTDMRWRDELHVRWRNNRHDKNDRFALPLAYALAAFGDDGVVEYLVSQIETAPSDEIDNLVTALKNSEEKSLLAIKDVAESAGAKLKARLAIVALYLGNIEVAADACQIENRKNPVQRTTFINEFPSWHGDLSNLYGGLPKTISDPSEESGSVRSALCQAIGKTAEKEAEDGDAQHDWRGTWTSRLKTWFKDQPDKETHSATGYALRQLNAEPRIDRSKKPIAGRDWYVNKQGITLLKIQRGQFIRSEYDPTNTTNWKPKKQQEVTLTRPFWLADREVTVGLFNEFMQDSYYTGAKPPGNGPGTKLSPTRENPVSNASWYDAVLFCNWLSWKEGLTEYYKREGEVYLAEDIDRSIVAGTYVLWSSGFNAEADGYRLPLNAELEYACRAGTTTVYSFGDDPAMLSDYAAFVSKKHTRKCGTLLPNGWGLFDVHGNVWEWCHDWHATFGNERTAINPCERTKRADWGRARRGGGCGGSAPFVTSHIVDSFKTVHKVDAGRESNDWGFRVARNCLP